MIRTLELNDKNAWLNLARYAEALFGGMVEDPGFLDAMEKLINEKSVICIDLGEAGIAGIIAFDKQENEIAWLFVDQDHRGNRYGYMLVEAALQALDQTRPVIVQTFSTDIIEGSGARRLYQSFGFEDWKEAGKNPAGYDTVLMRKEVS